MSVPKKITQLPAKAPASQTVTPLEMLNRAVQSGADIAVLEKLMALEERWRAGQARMAYDQAIADAKAKIKPVQKNKHVFYPSKDKEKGPTDYWHEDLAEIAKTVDPILSEHGLSYRFRTSQANNAVTVTCIVSHREGHFEETPLSSAYDKSGGKNDIQAIGSAVTYLQRYTLKVALGLAATKDDDGRKTEAPAVISEEQLAAISQLVEETEADVIKLCRYLKVAALSEIPAPEYERVVKLLEARREAK